MKKQELIINVWVADSADELSETDSLLLNEALNAARNSYAPYSNFNVGVAVLLENGEIICGSNQENIAYPSGLCAERVAMFYANSKYPEVAIKSIAISSLVNGKQSKQAIYPCGACRQSMIQSEVRQKKGIRIIMAGNKDIKIVDSVKSLLPLNFDLDDCEII